MIVRLFHTLVATSVVAGSAAAASYGLNHWAPEGRAHDAVERWITAPGQAVYSRLAEDRDARKKVEAGEARLEKAGLDLKRLQDSLVGYEPAKGAARAKAVARRLTHLYNVGAWAAAGLAACLAWALLFDIDTIIDAIFLGLRVSLGLAFLQGALIMGGGLAVSKPGG
ncbi:MAG: hypothetical protein NTY77_15135 [Elusimicrobia bacterium]|nr:hypothetical protein [Elusimicrobiota bacterium]